MLRCGDFASIEQPASSIRVHIWDFGGQEIMHATHQFFYSRTNESGFAALILFLRVLNERTDPGDAAADVVLPDLDLRPLLPCLHQRAPDFW